MPGKLSSELENVLKELKDRRAEERAGFLQQIREKEQEIAELLQKIESLKKEKAEALQSFEENLTQLKSKFAAELGIANEKVRILEDENLKLNAEQETLKKQIEMEKKLRQEDLNRFQKKEETLLKNAQIQLDKKESEIISLEGKQAKAQEKFNEDLLAERIRWEAETQALKKELEETRRLHTAESIKFAAQLQDKEETIQNLKRKILELQNEIGELKKLMKAQREDYEIELKNLDKNWSEVARKKDKEKKELEQQIKSLEKDVASQWESRLKEAEEEKKILTGKILELQRQIEEMHLNQEKILVEKDEFYRKKIAELRAQQMELQTLYQMKENELNAIKSELESEIEAISGVKKEETSREKEEIKAEKKEEAEEKPGILKTIFKKKTPEKEEERLFEEPEQTRSARERQIILILEQKKDNLRELEEKFESLPEEEKSETAEKIEKLKSEIAEWQKRLKK